MVFAAFARFRAAASRACLVVLVLGCWSLGLAQTAAAQQSMPAIPFLELWLASPHANAKAEAFNHWNKEGAVPLDCAMCHSSVGYRDFLGADGSTAGKVDHPAPIGTVVDCVACHNEKTVKLESVTFPSGATIGNLGTSARCMICHQGRQSTPDVNRAVAGIGEDTVSGKLRFINVHYRAAAATLWGTNAKGGYEYGGKTYHGRLVHPSSLSTCAQCHNPHSLKVAAETCATCHAGQALKAIRMSTTDYDGDGNVREGIADEISTLRDMLGRALADYAKSVSGKPLVYSADHHPYFFNDTNANGVADKGEVSRDNAYKAWTPRLVKAAYNYQFIIKDPGAYAHNPVYAIQLLYDSLESLSARARVDMARLKRP